MYDLLIKNGLVYDGLNNGPVHLDIAIKGEKITSMGKIDGKDAKQVVDAEGLAVCPGFIDIHSHADIAVFEDPNCEAKILQGVTTEVIGNCGLSVTPARKANFEQIKEYISPSLGKLTEDRYWQDLSSYFNSLEQHRSAVNVATYIGHGTLRIAAMGFSAAKADPRQLDDMKRMLEDGLRSGAKGISFGLIYAPGCFADDYEIKELVKTAAKLGKMANFHMRNESNLLLKSVQQLIGYAKETGAHIHISHLKASGEANWHQMKKVLESVDEAVSQGLKITCDQYPYTAGSTTITALMPQWALEGGIEKLLQRMPQAAERAKIADAYKNGIEGWDCLVRENGYSNIIVNSVEDQSLRGFEGKSITAIASEWNTDEFNTLLDFIIRSKAKASIVVVQQSEENVEMQMQSKHIVIGSDGLHVGRLPHPRLYGTFPRVLGKYVRDRKVLPLSEAIHKMTAKTADILGINDRGILEPGKFADIVIFDPLKVSDKSTYENPRQSPVGVKYVIVNGKVAVADGKLTGILSGIGIHS